MKGLIDYEQVPNVPEEKQSTCFNAVKIILMAHLEYSS